ncbi:lytic transglycosylase domain-containing protein [Thauera butanivorans]|uniref:lytic transglycosylase domain-containing protein n=1 Tax=Thauera butanivorans TaxID=86174 RepID=UPI001C3F4039|nr:lytic transglycosylase domain-containing protein [Thauera butanivorans]
MTITLALALGISSATAAVPPAYQACFEQAAQRYGLHALELAAHACVESSMRADAINDRHVARTGSVDLGLMQINSRWLPKLEPQGITRDRLLTDACTNIEVGAGILADLKKRHGDSWNATGAYNAACTQLKGEACERARATYAWKVYGAMQALARRGACS